MIIYLKYWFPKKFSAFTVFPFIFIRNKEDRNNKELINHEKIHLEQQKELLFIFFFIAYLAAYLYLLIKIKNRYQAYKQICFEREAYQHESNDNYLINRKRFAFFNYCQ